MLSILGFLVIVVVATLTESLFCVYLVFVALTAPGFGAATTTAAAPATGFSFGSTNTGKIHTLCTKPCSFVLFF